MNGSFVVARYEIKTTLSGRRFAVINPIAPENGWQVVEIPHGWNMNDHAAPPGCQWFDRKDEALQRRDELAAEADASATRG
jgi:hypothetical protein